MVEAILEKLPLGVDVSMAEKSPPVVCFDAEKCVSVSLTH